MTEIATKDLVVNDEALGIKRHVFAGQPIPPDLVDAYRDAGGDTDEVEPESQPTMRVGGAGATIADRDLVVHDPAIGIDRKIGAGQPVPPDLVDLYLEAGGKEADPAAAPPVEEKPEGYDDKPVDELVDEVDKRGLEVKGTGSGGNVLKADLIAALKADDEGA